MVNKTTDHVAEREKLLRKLVAEIEAANFDSENLRDHNTLALILLVRALDILSARYEDAEVVYVLNFMVADQRARRRVPVTEEYVQKQNDMRMWLP